MTPLRERLLADAKRAHERGEKVQCYHSGTRGKWVDVEAPGWFEDVLYRPKPTRWSPWQAEIDAFQAGEPVEVRSVGSLPGSEWSDWCLAIRPMWYENGRNEYRANGDTSGRSEVIAAWLRGGSVECKADGGAWVSVGRFGSGCEPPFGASFMSWRIRSKAEPADPLAEIKRAHADGATIWAREDATWRSFTKHEIPKPLWDAEEYRLVCPWVIDTSRLSASSIETATGLLCASSGASAAFCQSFLASEQAELDRRATEMHRAVLEAYAKGSALQVIRSIDACGPSSERISQLEAELAEARRDAHNKGVHIEQLNECIAELRFQLDTQQHVSKSWEELAGKRLRQIRQLNELLVDCQAEIRAYLEPDGGLTPHALVSRLIGLLDSPRQRKAQEGL